MDREEMDRVRKDLNVIQQAAGLTNNHSHGDVRVLCFSLVAFGIAFTMFAMWQPEWVSYSIFFLIIAFLGITFSLVRAGMPASSRREMKEISIWLGSLLGVCLVFAIWGVLVSLPMRVLCGAEMFISGIFPLPISIAARDSKAWVCGAPLMAAGLALPFVALPVGMMAGIGIILSGVAYWLAHWRKLKEKKEIQHAD